jgi:hypothetical protein
MTGISGVELAFDVVMTVAVIPGHDLGRREPPRMTAMVMSRIDGLRLPGIRSYGEAGAIDRSVSAPADPARPGYRSARVISRISSP